MRNDFIELKKRLPKNPPKDLRERVIARLQTDLEISFALMASLREVKAHHEPAFEDGQVTWSLKTNKLPLLLTGSVSFISEYFDDLVSGVLIDDYLKQLDSVTILDPYDPVKKNYHGNSYASFLRVALYLVLVESGVTAENLRVDASAIFHTAPLPKGFDPEVVHPEFEKFSWFYKDGKSPEQGELFFVHSGYSYGATRGETRCAVSEKMTPPKDCSSWMQELLGIPVMSTAHQLILYNTKFGGFIPDDWDLGDQMLSIEKSLDPIEIKYVKDIRPGYIFTVRTFNLEQDPTMTETLGAGGHVGIVTAVNKSRDTVTVMSYARDLPGWGFNGFGLKEFPALSQGNKKIFYFKPKR